MSILVIVEHDNQAVNVATLNTVAAAQEIGGDMHLLVAGENRRSVASAAATIEGAGKVLLFHQNSSTDIADALCPIRDGTKEGMTAAAAAAAKQEDQEEVPRSLGSGLSRNSCSSSCKMTATAARLQDSDRHHQVSRECSTHHRIHSTYVDSIVSAVYYTMN